ncbi:MAG: hypothetical protein IJA18_06270 [Ruminococcus sp.]|nr:hypothetical protein [Ruminococcus sp.]
MTKYELMVIAAAAAAFVLINIIMWSIIIAKEKKSRKNNAPAQPAMPYNAIPAMTQAVPQSVTQTRRPVQQTVTQTRTVAFNTRANPTEPPQRPRVKRSDFILLDDIVIVHTDERIE